MWSSELSKLGQILGTTLFGYVIILAMLRIVGKRSLAKLNIFDFVVTIALGSILASLATGSTKLVDGLLGITLLLGAQYIISWLAVRSDFVDKLVKASPRLLFYKGSYMHDALRSERVSEREVDEQIRSNGFTDKEEVFAVVLETTGEITVIGASKEDKDDCSVLEQVSGFDEAHRG